MDIDICIDIDSNVGAAVKGLNVGPAVGAYVATGTLVAGAVVAGTAVLGAAVGRPAAGVGAAVVGAAVSRPVGAVVAIGAADFAKVGAPEGTNDGRSLGTCDGVPDGVIEGRSLGNCVVIPGEGAAVPWGDTVVCAPVGAGVAVVCAAVGPGVFAVGATVTGAGDACPGVGAEVAIN